MLVWKVQTMGMGSGNPSRQVNTSQGQPKNDSGGEQLLVPTTLILGRLSWIFKKDDAIKISQKLSEHREIMFRALCTIICVDDLNLHVCRMLTKQQGSKHPDQQQHKHTPRSKYYTYGTDANSRTGVHEFGEGCSCLPYCFGTASAIKKYRLGYYLRPIPAKFTFAIASVQI